MKLQSIEMKGFKSFYRKTKIEFPEGIISIVGPNGSGKSNILDAFRWVLGEQSAKSLRGERMDDVIFSGTKKHPQSNSCEVEIILDNSDGAIEVDFSQISIKRKTYRDGDTKYYINGKSCRLKDVRELFLDSGIGKEGYSIISQGKIDEIINASSLERRKLLEEASGISRYRYKKEESEKMIEDSKVNLERLMDIFAEIQRQIKPLAEQKQKATEFLKLKETLKQSDISMMMKEYNNIDEEIRLAEKSKTDLEGQIDQLNKELEQGREQNRLLEEKKEASSQKLHKLEKEKNQIEFKQNDLKNQIERHKEKIEIRRKLAKKSASEKESLELKEKSLESGILKLEEEYSHLNKTANEKEEEQNKLDVELRELDSAIRKTQEEIDKVQGAIEEKLSSTGRLESQLLLLQSNFEREKAEKESNALRIRRNKDLMDQLQKEFQDQRLKTSGLEAKMEETADKKQKNKKEAEELQSVISRLQEERSEALQKLRDTSTKRGMYVKMEEEMDGFNKSVKTILNNKDLKGIIDTVSNIIKTDEKYEKAIETALGASMQNIITRDSHSAKNAIELLKKTKSGRATFMPLDSIKGIRLNLDQVLIASDVVRCDEKYKNIISSLLGRTILAESMEEGIATARKLDNRYRIVTLQGEVFSPGGSITGGHYFKSNDLLSRKRIIKDLEALMDQESHQKEEAELSLGASLKTRELLSEEGEKLSKKLESLQSELNKQKSAEVDLQNRLKFIKNEIENTERENKGYQGESKNNDLEISRLQILQKELKDQYELDKVELRNLKESQNLILEKKAHKNELRNNIKFDLISLKNQAENILREKNRIEYEIQDLKNQLKSKEEESGETYGQIRLSESSISDCQLELQLCQVELDEIAEEYDQAASALKKENQSLEGLADTIKKQEASYIDLLEKKYKLESDWDRTSVIGEQIIERLREEYDLDIAQAKKLETIETSKTEIAELKKAIGALGNVNLNAIEEYDLLGERYETYKVQIDDLDESIKGLEKIISKLEEDMARDFKHHFETININFGKIFTRIFGGGEARLILNDPSDVLNSHIDIVAQPPGKKLKTMSVLSGGEKSLMGIGMLFAIQMTKPAPFCILDEIDAALDDTNISRFNGFLKEMSKDIQFINITHRRGTMETSDYIYGVTMQDKGVSNIVSIKFEEAQEYIEQ